MSDTPSLYEQLKEKFMRLRFSPLVADDLADRADDVAQAYFAAERERVQTAVIDVLCGQALADHLGDVRNEEATLWNLLRVPELPFEDPAWDTNSAFAITKARLRAAGLPLPEHLDYDDEE